jgi:hypothetical protein
MVLKTQVGGNSVSLTISDSKGNTATISRHVTRL